MNTTHQCFKACCLTSVPSKRINPPKKGKRENNKYNLEKIEKKYAAEDFGSGDMTVVDVNRRRIWNRVRERESPDK